VHRTHLCLYAVSPGLAVGCKQDIVPQLVQNENLGDLWLQSDAVWCRAELHESQVTTDSLVVFTGAVLNRIFIFVVSSPSIYDRC